MRQRTYRQERLRRYKFGDALELDCLRSINGERCRCCEAVLEDKDAVIDHNHATGAVRGVICNSCNTLLGRLGDDLDAATKRFAQIQEYLANAEDETALIRRVVKDSRTGVTGRMKFARLFCFRLVMNGAWKNELDLLLGAMKRSRWTRRVIESKTVQL